MRALPASTPLRLFAFACLSTVGWAACDRLELPADSTEAASDATASTGAGGSGGVGPSAPIEARFRLPATDATDAAPEDPAKH